MPPWLPHLISAQKKNSKVRSSRWVQLATISKENTPRVRTVVFRGWSNSYEMNILTDSRSEKFNELEFNNNVEVCWLFTKSKCQFRFRGKSSIDNSSDTFRHWDKLDKEAQSLWRWPAPGKKYQPNRNENIKKKDNPKIIDNFVLLKIKIFHVDQLILNKPIHIRRQWIRDKDWIEERINP